MRKFSLLIKISFCFIILFFFIGIHPADAHVKWFTNGSYADRPSTVGEVINNLFLWLLLACIAVIVLGVWIDARISSSSFYQKINSWFSQRKQYSVLVMRVASAMMLLLSWQGDAMLAPTLKVPDNFYWVGWFQFALAFLLLFNSTVPVAGIGMIILYLIGSYIFHPFHILDYLIYVGAGYYLAVSNSKKIKLKRSGLAVLYLAFGFSICWVALEKFIYPEWSLFLVKEHPSLALGLNYNFFVTSVAFVEFGLGYLLIVCMLQRPLAVIISIIFVLTSTIFGKAEIIGHTLIHGSLIVFLLEGPGILYEKLTRTFTKVFNRIVFTTVSFLLLFFLLLYAYYGFAEYKYVNKQKSLAKNPEHQKQQIELAGYPASQLPTVWMDLQEDPAGGYNIHLNTVNFKFTPEDVNKSDAIGEGYAQLHVNGADVARIYSPDYYLYLPEPGTYTISVVLSSNNRQEYVVHGRPVEDEKTIQVTNK